ncbi:MAG: hypothetical protein R3E39_06585 [Anaerolineae bacterium]
MSFDMQIRTILVPTNIWYNGDPELPHSPLAAMAQRDAMAIERRAQKRVNVRSEKRRYVLYCDRIQGIASELSSMSSNCPNAFVWPAQAEPDSKVPSAYIIFTISTNILRFVQTKNKSMINDEQPYSLYPRASTIFVPPSDANVHFDFYQMIHEHPSVDKLFELCSNMTQNDIHHLSPDECQRGFQMRYEFLKMVASREYGLVDVLEII